MCIASSSSSNSSKLNARGPCNPAVAPKGREREKGPECERQKVECAPPQDRKFSDATLGDSQIHLLKPNVREGGSDRGGVAGRTCGRVGVSLQLPGGCASGSGGSAAVAGAGAASGGEGGPGRVIELLHTEAFAAGGPLSVRLVVCALVCVFVCLAVSVLLVCWFCDACGSGCVQ
jgi:hypothetical protein